MRISDWSSDVCASDLRAWTGSAAQRPAAWRKGACSTATGAAIANKRACASATGRRGDSGITGAELTKLTVWRGDDDAKLRPACRSEEHTSELQSLMRTSYAVFCLKKKKN